MKILNIDEFLEKLNIGKLNIRDVQVSNLPKTPQQPSTPYYELELDNKSNVYARLTKKPFCMPSASSYEKKFFDAISHTIDVRFKPWETEYGIGTPKFMEKHSKRAKMSSLAYLKLLATLYAALSLYCDKSLGDWSQRLINAYIERVKHDFNVDDNDIISAFFK